MNKDVKNWLDMVEYDLVTAKHMFETGRYVYVIFMCHLAIEKAFKSIVVVETKKVPPKTHDLIYLFKFTKVQLEQKLSDFLGMINNASVVTRYPEDLAMLVNNYPKEVAGDYLEKTEEIIRCIKNDLRLQEQ